MRRAIPAIAATAAGLAALLGYKTGTAPRTAVAATGTTVPSAADSPTTAATRTTRPTATTTPPTTAAARTVDGSAVYTKFGNVQVEITVRGGRLVDVRPLQLPYQHQRSQDISDQAAPMLRSEALQAQSANIHTITGATYTSYAYEQSLQAALDAARS